MTYYIIRNDELYHHGILGQKWGIRRFQNPDGSLTAAGRKRYGIEGQNTFTTSEEEKKGLTEKQKKALIAGGVALASTLAIVGGVYIAKKYKLNSMDLQMPIANRGMFDEIDLNKFEKWETESKIISKNNNFQRISSKPIEDYIEQGQIYISHLDKDNAIYKERMPGYIKRWYKLGMTDEKTAYVHNFKFKKDLKIASKKDCIEAYIKASKDTGYDNERTEFAFQSFIRSLAGNRDSDLTGSFIKELQKKGFDGIVDYNDAASGFSKDPLFIFDAANLIESSKSHRLGAIEKFINVMKS